jgi:hypothetical protein
MRQRRTKGIAQSLEGISTAGHSHRLTSGGKAEALPTEDFQGKAAQQVIV